jgi:hypothetical protein
MQYIIIAPTLREAMYCFDHMLRLFPDKITKASKRMRRLTIDSMDFTFTSEDLYYRDGYLGSRAEALSSRYVERQLDRYVVLKGD